MKSIFVAEGPKWPTILWWTGFSVWDEISNSARRMVIILRLSSHSIVLFAVIISKDRVIYSHHRTITCYEQSSSDNNRVMYNFPRPSHRVLLTSTKAGEKIYEEFFSDKIIKLCNKTWVSAKRGYTPAKKKKTETVEATVTNSKQLRFSCDSRHEHNTMAEGRQIQVNSTTHNNGVIHKASPVTSVNVCC